MDKHQTTIPLLTEGNVEKLQKTGFANYVAMVNPSKGAEFLASMERIKQKYDESKQYII